MASYAVKYVMVCHPKSTDGQETNDERLELAPKANDNPLNLCLPKIRREAGERKTKHKQRHCNGEDAITEALKTSEPYVLFCRAFTRRHTCLVCEINKSFTDVIRFTRGRAAFRSEQPT